jgi:2-oxoglutarate dehydrogenase E2 component (dihydrolipoamide succinyltransferase)
MAKQVVMPQMGESVAEGTIVRWLKKVGDAVERDEPLFEISTDKVDAEIPSPSAGVLSEIKVREGETVPINTVVGVVDETQAGKAPSKAAAPPPAAGKGPAKTESKSVAAPASAPSSQTASAFAQGATADKTAGKPSAPSAPRAPVAPAFAPSSQTASASAQGATADKTAGKPNAPRPWSAAEARELRLSPVVRTIARAHHVDVRNIAGSGAGGRVTKNDILAYLDAGAPAAPVAPRRTYRTQLAGSESCGDAGLDPARFERTPMSVMRRKIAEHMVTSKRISAHVHSASRSTSRRSTRFARRRKTSTNRRRQAHLHVVHHEGVRRSAPEGAHRERVGRRHRRHYKKDINIGIAVALDWGLIVPVLKNVDAMSLLDISKAIADLAARARDKKLKPEEVQGGTFTITNPGVFGALFGMPIISQPQVAIVGIGAVEKRPVVVNDEITIRLRAYMILGYDHRIIDGAVADEFMQVVKKMIENWDVGTA